MEKCSEGRQAAYKLIDTSVFCGPWPFRSLRPRTLPELKEYLAGHGVCRAWVTSTEAVLLPDPMTANEPLLVEAAKDPFWVPVTLLDPSLPGWEDDYRRSLAMGARAVKLTPNYHQYSLSSPAVDRLAGLLTADRLPFCIQMRMMDERAHHPLMKVPGVPAAEVAELALRHPELSVVACAVYNAELRFLQKAPNVVAEISYVESVETLLQAKSVLGVERLLFGSHSPFLYMAAVQAKLDAHPDMINEAELRAVCYENAGRLIPDGR